MAEEESRQGQRYQTQRQGGRRLKQRSKVWEDFTRYTGADGKEKAKCNRCGKVYAYHGTKNLKEHLDEGCGGPSETDDAGAEQQPQPLASLLGQDDAMQEQLPPPPPLPLPPPRAPSRPGGSSRRESSGLQEQASKHLVAPRPRPGSALSQEPGLAVEEEQAHHGSRPGLDEKEATRDLARMIALGGHDPSFLEDEYFRSFVHRLNPGFKLPSREAIEEMCDDVFTQSRDKVRRGEDSREAAHGKAYVQQLESSKLKLAQLEQELQKARQQGIFISSSGDQTHAMSGNGALTFDIEYARWLEDQNKQINELRTAVNAHASDNDLRLIVDGIMAHYDEIFKVKGVAAKADPFHILSGMWKTPVERCFLWLGGFPPSELLKLLASHLEPLNEQQLLGLTLLQQSSQQAEDALSLGWEALQQSLATLALGPSGSSGNEPYYMSQIAMAIGKLETLVNFLLQADILRQQTLHQMQRILTIRQTSRALLAIHNQLTWLRALSSLWLTRLRK